jgi:hypothetical protein
MKPSRTLGQLAAVFLSISTVSATWPRWLPEIDALVVRQDDESTSATARPTQTATSDDAEETSASASTSSGRRPATTGNLNTASIDTDASATGTAAKGNSTTTKHKTFPANSPAGGITLMTPAATTMALFKIQDYVTFVWNYTNLLATPTAVDVLAYDSAASQTHTLTQNMSFSIPNTLLWDTNQYQQENGATKGLRVAEYTLIIYDAESNPTDTAEAGYLGVYNSFQFGMYTPKPYTPFSEWTCAACSAAQDLGAAGAVGLAVTAAFAAGAALMVL